MPGRIYIDGEGVLDWTRCLPSRLQENSRACEEPVRLNPSGGEPTVVERKVRTLIDSFPSNRELTHVPFEVIAR